MTEKTGDSSSERLQQIEQKIDKYIEELSLNLKHSDSINKYIGVSEEQLRGFTAEECEMAAILLNEYSITIQTKYNKLHAMINWIDSNINWMIADKVGSFKGYSYEERKIAATKDNSATYKLSKLRADTLLEKDTLYDLSRKIEGMAKFYAELSKGKRWNR